MAVRPRWRLGLETATGAPAEITKVGSTGILARDVFSVAIVVEHNVLVIRAGAPKSIVFSSGIGPAAQAVVLNGAGEVILTRPADIVGSIVVGSGTLRLDSPTGPALRGGGNLLVGDGSTLNGTARVLGLRSNQLADTMNVTVRGDGTLRMRADVGGAGSIEQFGDLTINGGHAEILATNTDLAALTIRTLTITSGTFDVVASNIRPATLSIGDLVMDGGALRILNNAQLFLRGHVRATGGLVHGSANATETLNINAPVVVDVSSGGFRIADLGIRGQGSVTKDGPGTLTFDQGGINDYIGDTFVLRGTVNLRRPFVVSRGKLVIGGGIGDARVNLEASGSLGNVPVEIRTNGVLRATAFQFLPGVTVSAGGMLSMEALGITPAFTLSTPSLTLRGGRVGMFGPATLRLTGELRALSSPTEAVIQIGFVDIDNTDLTVTVEEGPLPVDLRIEAFIMNSVPQGPNGLGLIKRGQGTLALANASTYRPSSTSAAPSVSAMRRSSSCRRSRRPTGSSSRFSATTASIQSWARSPTCRKAPRSRWAA